MKNTTPTSLLLLFGILLFAYLKFNFPDGRPNDLVSFIAVGAWMSASILVFGESGWWMLKQPSVGKTDRSLGLCMVCAAVALSAAIGWHLYVTLQVGMILALAFGTLLYLTLLRMPFIALTK